MQRNPSLCSFEKYSKRVQPKWSMGKPPLGARESRTRGRWVTLEQNGRKRDGLRICRRDVKYGFLKLKGNRTRPIPGVVFEASTRLVPPFTRRTSSHPQSRLPHYRTVAATCWLGGIRRGAQSKSYSTSSNMFKIETKDFFFEFLMTWRSIFLYIFSKLLPTYF